MSITEQQLHDVVGKAVDDKINGKLVGLKADNVEIKAHLARQDIILTDVKALLEERKFRHQLWSLGKKLFAGIISLGGAYLLVKGILHK